MAFCLVAGQSACAPDPVTPVSVIDVRNNIHSWNGKIVTVDGWLAKCGDLDCGLYQSLADAHTVELGDHSSNAWGAAMGRRLGIASDKKFDAAAAELSFSRIRLKAKVNDECRGWMTGCTDRVPDLQPISFEIVTKTKEK